MLLVDKKTKKATDNKLHKSNPHPYGTPCDGNKWKMNI